MPSGISCGSELVTVTRVRAGELDVHVQRLSPPAPAPIVVCVHGVLLDSLASYYLTVAPMLFERGFDVIMYDLRGHGRTTRPAEGYRLERFVEDLDALLDALDITRPVHLVGNSFGGAIAFGLAAARPDRVASVIAIEAEPPTPEWAGNMVDALAWAANELAIEGVLDLAETHYGGFSARRLKGVKQILGSTTIAEEIPLSRTMDPDLSAIRCPVLGVFGSDSELAAQVPRWHARLAHCRTLVLPDQGHSVLVERTGETAEAILEWVGAAGT
jgi:pimeloyl-ACP methyl ester carboxylesterase